MAKIDGELIEDIGRKWTELRKRWVSKKYTPNQGQVKEFFDETNAMSGKLIAALGTSDPDFYVALSECAGNAAAMLRQREETAKGGR